MKSCSFTGHRPEKLIGSKMSISDVIKALEFNIEKAIDNGTTIFLTGMARGIDLWAAEIILKKKRENTNLKLISVIPFPDQFGKWSDQDKKQYQTILKQCDDIVNICSFYQKNAYKYRNQYLVNHADSLIAVYNPKYKYSGTAQTVRMAEKRQLEIMYIDI